MAIAYGDRFWSSRIAGRGRCNTSQSITSVPRGSDRFPAVNVCVAGDEWPSVCFADGLSNAPRLPLRWPNALSKHLVSPLLPPEPL
jgi:hypothetical protein